MKTGYSFAFLLALALLVLTTGSFFSIVLGVL